MKSLFAALALLVSIAAQAGDAQPESYQLKVVRGGKTITRVAYPYWSGEYPGPVIAVGKQDSGTTKVVANKSVRDLKTKVNCTIKNGLYHPWSQTNNSTLNYYSLTDVEEYTALRDTKIEADGESERQMKKGDVITNIFYFGEGWCGGTLKTSDDIPRQLNFFCDAIMGDSIYGNDWRKTKAEKGEHEQWIHVRCEEGHKAFINAESLLKVKGVSQGNIGGYGEVSR